MEDKSGTGGILAGVVGGAVFLIFMFFLRLGVPMSLLGGLVGLGTTMALSRPSKKAISLQVPGIDPQGVQEVIAQGRDFERQFRDMAKELPLGAVKQNCFALAELSSKIWKDVEQDPKDYKAARQFFAYYPEAALKILTIYRDVSRRGIPTREFKELEAKVEKNMAMVEQAFTAQLAKLQDDNLLDLDTEITVLENTLKMEGLGEEIRKRQG